LGRKEEGREGGKFGLLLVGVDEKKRKQATSKVVEKREAKKDTQKTNRKKGRNKYDEI